LFSGAGLRRSERGDTCPISRLVMWSDSLERRALFQRTDMAKILVLKRGETMGEFLPMQTQNDLQKHFNEVMSKILKNVALPPEIYCEDAHEANDETEHSK
jgi:hypothetical protein